MYYQSLIPFIIYFIIIIGIGIYASRFSSRGISEFFIGGRQMNRFVVALSAVVSGRSAWLLLGVSGLAYLKGLTAIWAVIGYIIVEFFLFLYYAPKIRRFSETHDCITIPDFFEARFRDSKNTLRIIIVIIFIIFMVTYIAAQFVGGGKAFMANFGISQNAGLLITAGIILIYTLLGGFLAVSLTDVFQGIFMIIALVAMPVTAIIYKGGWNTITTELNNIDVNLLNLFSQPAVIIFGFIGIGLGSPGNPHILVRYMSIKDPSQFRWTAVIGTIWNIILAAGAILAGLIGRVFFHKLSLLPGSDEENIFVHLSNDLFEPFFAGLILASIFAAIMSTADSQLLVAASSIVRDLYEKVFNRNKKLSHKELIDLSRIMVFILVIFAVFLGIIIEDQILWFVLFAWAGLGAAIGPASILSLFWKKTTKTGVIAGLLTGTITVFIWKSITVLNNLIYELIPAFFIAFAVTVIFSYAGSGRFKTR
ncbi:MAG: sodium/proline symporter [Bacteroidales bacterium]|nr:MAG: sodium/proline symporter [Bacteroidales bacterium]